MENDVEPFNVTVWFTNGDSRSFYCKSICYANGYLQLLTDSYGLLTFITDNIAGWSEPNNE